MKKSINNGFNSKERKETEEMLYRALGALYSFERIEVEKFGLTFQQIFLLKYLRRNSPLKMSEVVSVMKIRAFSATRLIDQLAKPGYVERETVENDRRGRIVKITSKGLTAVKQIEDHAFKLITPVLSGLSEEEFAGLIITLEKFSMISGL